MKVKELKEYLEKYSDDIEILFSDTCANYEMEIYQLEEDYEENKLRLFLIGDYKNE